MSSPTESIARHLAAQRDKIDPISEARKQGAPDGVRVIEVLGRLRALVFEHTPTAQLTSDIEVVHGLISGLIGAPKATRFIEALPQIRHCVALDVEARFEGDPAAKTYAEVVA